MRLKRREIPGIKTPDYKAIVFQQVLIDGGPVAVFSLISRDEILPDTFSLLTEIKSFDNTDKCPMDFEVYIW